MESVLELPKGTRGIPPPPLQLSVPILYNGPPLGASVSSPTTFL